MTKPYYFILDQDGKPKPVAFEEWSVIILEGNKWHIGRTKVGKYDVSTVFLGMDLNFLQEGEPLALYETYVFGEGPYAGRMEHYATLEEAQVGHETMVNRVKGDSNAT